MAFTVSDVLYISSAIDELLYMSEGQPSTTISRGYIERRNQECIKISFLLKHGKSEINISADFANFSYVDRDDKIVNSIKFTSEQITDTNGSFHQVFKQIRVLDRQYSNLVKATDSSIDRASFGLTKEN